MNNLNSVLVEGNLVRDPEIKHNTQGNSLCCFTIATDRTFKQGEGRIKEVSFLEVTAWSRLAELCGEYLTKGRKVRVTGRLKQDRWEDKAGTRRSKIHIIAGQVDFLPSPKGDGVKETVAF